MSVTFAAARSEVADASQSAGGENRGQRCGEDEPGRTTPEKVDHCRRSGNVAAHHAKGLAQGPLDRRQAMHGAVAFGNSTSARAVHANRVDLVDISHRPYRSATSQIS